MIRRLENLVCGAVCHKLGELVREATRGIELGLTTIARVDEVGLDSVVAGALPLELLDRWATGWGIGSDVCEELGAGLVDQGGAVGADELEQLRSAWFVVLDRGEDLRDGSGIRQQRRAEATEAAVEPFLGDRVVQGNATGVGSAAESAGRLSRVDGELADGPFGRGSGVIGGGGRAQAEDFGLEGRAGGVVRLHYYFGLLIGFFNRQLIIVEMELRICVWGG